MTAQVLPLRRRKWEPLRDSKGHRIPKFLVYRETGVIFYRDTFKKLGLPPIFESTGETTVGRAKTRAAVMVQQHKNKHLGIDDSHVFARKADTTFRDIAEDVLARYTPKRRPGTQAMHRIYIGELVAHWGDRDINAITPEHFEAWIDRRRAKEKRQTFADYAKHMNLVMRHAYNHRRCTHLVRFKNPDGQKHERTGRVYSDAEITHLWDAMNEDTRDQFALCYECMMRLREALYLTWDRVDLKTGKVTLRASDVKTGSKTGRGREFQLSANALARLRARHKRQGDASPYVFPSPENPAKPMHQNKTAWRLAKANAKVKGRARWHDLRHTALSKALLEARMDPVAVSEYAGVSLRTIQAVYLHSKAEHTKGVAQAVSIKKV